MPEKKLYESTKTVHLDSHLHDEIRDYANTKRLKVQEVVNNGLREWLNRKLKEDFF